MHQRNVIRSGIGLLIGKFYTADHSLLSVIIYHKFISFLLMSYFFRMPSFFFLIKLFSIFLLREIAIVIFIKFFYSNWFQGILDGGILVGGFWG